METEKEFLEKYKNLTAEQALHLAYKFKEGQEQVIENYNSLRRRYYGRKSEQVSPEQLSLFNEAEVTVEAASKESQKEPTGSEACPGKEKGVKRGKRNSKLKQAIVKEEDIWADGKDHCGEKLEEVHTDVVEYLEYQQAQYILHRYKVHNITSKKDNEKNLTMTVYSGRNFLPKKLIPGSLCTPSLIAHFICEKLALGVPFYRQSQDLERRGIYISRQNMCKWAIRISEDYLELLFKQMLEDIRKCAIINCDETTFQCLEEISKGRESDSYAWLVMSNEYEENQMAVYNYDATRKYGVLEGIIGKSYSGVMQSDGYGAYDEYPGTDKKAGCWSHARRKFFDALTSANLRLYKKYQKASRKEKEKIIDDYPTFGVIMKEIAYIDKLFHNENQYKKNGYTPDEILQHRKIDDPGILDEIHKHTEMMKATCAPGGKLGEAINYVLNQWERLNYFMKDGRIPLSNNIAERQGIKPFVMARKNFLFADTEKGARSTCIWFSLLLSASMNHLNPERYLNYILEQAAEHPMTPELISNLLPYSKNLPSDLKIDPAR